MSTISTHILDTARGRPAPGIAVVLCRIENDDATKELGRGVTNDDGRVRDLVGTISPGTYRMTFEVGPYLSATHGQAFYPKAQVDFVVMEADGHYHIPLLLSPYGYSTYRGS